MRCYFNVRSKADISRLNLTHGPTTKKCKVTTDMLRSEVNSLGNPCDQSWKSKEGYGGKDLQKSKVLSLEWESEGWWNTTNNKYECHVCIIMQAAPIFRRLFIVLDFVTVACTPPSTTELSNRQLFNGYILSSCLGRLIVFRTHLSSNRSTQGLF